MTPATVTAAPSRNTFTTSTQSSAPGSVQRRVCGESRTTGDIERGTHLPGSPGGVCQGRNVG